MAAVERDRVDLLALPAILAEAALTSNRFGGCFGGQFLAQVFQRTDKVIRAVEPVGRSLCVQEKPLPMTAPPAFVATVDHFFASLAEGLPPSLRIIDLLRQKSDFNDHGMNSQDSPAKALTLRVFLPPKGR